MLFELQRGSGAISTSKDKISILVPGDVVADPLLGSAGNYTWVLPTTANQGAFLRRGRMDVTGDPLVNQELEFNARSIKVVVLDSDSWAT